MNDFHLIKEWHKAGLSAQEILVAAFAREHPGATVSAIAAGCDVEAQAARCALEKLQVAGQGDWLSVAWDD